MERRFDSSPRDGRLPTETNGRQYLLAFSALIVVTAQATSSPPPSNTLPVKEIVVAATPAYLSSGVWPFQRAPVTFTFEIRSLSTPIKDVLITSSGLGAVHFGTASPNSVLIVIPQLLSHNQVIHASIPITSFPVSGEPVTGKIVIRTRAETVEIPLRLHARRPSVLWAPLVWFWGIVLPAAVPGGIALFYFKSQKRWEAREEQQRVWEDTLVADKQELDDFFVRFYPNLCREASNEAEWIREIRDRLTKWIRLIPTRERDVLLKSLAKGGKGQIIAALAVPFYYWQREIESCATQ